MQTVCLEYLCYVCTVDSISSSMRCLGTNHPFQAVLVAVWLVLLFATPQIAAFPKLFYLYCSFN